MRIIRQILDCIILHSVYNQAIVYGQPMLERSMSAVLTQTKQLYRTALSVELIVLAGLFLLVWLLSGGGSAVSLLIGGMIALVAQLMFVYWVFFRKQAATVNKMSAFYAGEALKWLVTIVLIVLVFKGFPTVNIVLFFAGYFVILLCNSLLPFILRRRVK